MSLTEVPGDQDVAGEWVSKIFMLGRLLQKWPQEKPGSRLVVALSVPVRDFAAVLVATGWATAAKPRSQRPVHDVLDELSPGTVARIVTREARIMAQSRQTVVRHKVIRGRFHGDCEKPDRFRLGNSQWLTNRITAMAPASELEDGRHLELQIPEPGTIARITGMDKDWLARFCAPAQDICLVGTRKWLEEEQTVYLGWRGEYEAVKNILLPQGPHVATWSTSLVHSSKLDEQDLQSSLRLVVLDGASAAKYVAAVEAPVVVVILDRSVADETAQEVVLSHRRSWGDPVLLAKQFGWKPPTSIEVLAYEVMM